jgi:nucleoid-associated protein YgaU
MQPAMTDVRAQMPNYNAYKDWQRSGAIQGIAVHHSATANQTTGQPIGNAASFFDYHVNTRGWTHGGYNFVITGSGEIEYALDEKIAAYHAGFSDADNSEGLEFGQYWNNHYLAICMAGWFASDRTWQDANGRTQSIPNNFTGPSAAQMDALLALIQYLRQKYNIPVENVRGHRELPGNSTSCPGLNFNPAQLREKLRQLDLAAPTPEPEAQPAVNPGEHVVLLPDTDKYFDAAMAYIWKFKPDVSFAVEGAAGRWKYVTAVGPATGISDAQLDNLRTAGAVLVQRIPGTPTEAQSTLDGLAAANLRFLTTTSPTEPEPEPALTTYTVKSGDTLSRIALNFYGKSSLWNLIYEANQDILTSPSVLRPGQVLKIPAKP